MSNNIFIPQIEGKSQEEQIESKFQRRQDFIFSNENFSKIKEDSIKNEISLGNSNREKIFIQKRLKQKLIKENINTGKIENHLTISSEIYKRCQNMSVNIEDLKEILPSFNSNDIEKKYTGLVGLRKLLCLEDFPVPVLVELNVIPSIIQLLDNSPVEFIYESLWCLINIMAFEDQSAKIKYLGGVDKIIDLLDHPLDEIKDLALWNIESLSYDSNKLRNYFVHKKILNKIITILSAENEQNIIMHCTSIIKSIIKNYKESNIKSQAYLNRLINIISKILMDTKYDENTPEIRELFFNSIYIISYLSETNIDCRDSLIINGILPYLIELLRHNNNEKNLFLILGCLKILGNIISGNANQTQKILDYNIYDILKELMFHNNKRIKKEANWIISNIASGTQRNIMDLIDNGFFPLIYKIFKNEDKDIRVEAIWTLCNFTQINKDEYLQILLKQGLLEIISECLKSQDPKDIAISLEALTNLLEYGQKNSLNGNNLIAFELEKIGLFPVLENLQYHPIEMIYEKVLKTLETFFSTEIL